MRKRFASISDYLDANKKTQLQFAAELGISIAAMSRIVRGLTMPRPELAIRISEVTGVPIETMVRARRDVA